MVGCNCMWAQRRIIFKHSVKELLMLCPDMLEGTIARFYVKRACNAEEMMERMLSSVLEEE